MSHLAGIVSYPDFTDNSNIIRTAARSFHILSRCETRILNLSGCCMGIVTGEHENISGNGRIAAKGKSGLLWTGYITDIGNLKSRLETAGINGKDILNDSHVLLESYFAFGIESLQGLNGLYSIAIWDDKQKCFWAITDRYGFTKLYYWLGPDGLMFASECKAIISHPKYRKAMDKEGIVNFLGAGYCFGERTLFKDIRLIPQGCTLKYGDSELSFKKYWDYSVKPASGNLDELTDRFFFHIDSAFKRCINGEKNVFIPLSGGLDSRTMAGLASSAGLKIYTCTLGRKGSRDYRYGTKIGEKINSTHTSLEIRSDYFPTYAPLGIKLTDGQVINHPFYIFRIFDYKKPLSGLNTLISGIGGSEFVGLMRHGNIIKRPNVSLIQQHISQRFLRVFQDNELHGIMNNTFFSSSISNQDYLEQKIENAGADELIDKIWVSMVNERVRHFNSNILLSALGYKWNVYAPFADNQFVDFMLSVSKQLTDNKQKLFRHFLIKYLPVLSRIPEDKTGRKIKHSRLEQGIRWRKDYLMEMIPGKTRRQYKSLRNKVGTYQIAQKLRIGDNRNWVVDCDDAVRNGSSAYFHELLSDTQRIENVFNLHAVNRLFKDHMEKRVNAYQKICAIATIIEWRRQFGL